MRKIPILLFLLTLLSLNVSLAFSKTEADETGAGQTTDVTLTYHMEAAEKVELTVSVKGPGCLKDGEEIIRDGSNVYELNLNAEKEFIIEPDSGCEVVSLKINQKEASNQYSGKVAIRDIREDTLIEVEFREIKEKPDDSNQNVNDDSSSQTGGNTNGNGDTGSTHFTNGSILTGVNIPIGGMLLLLLIAVGVMVYTVMKKERDR